MNLPALLEKAKQITEHSALTMQHMLDFVEGREEEIPQTIFEVLKKKEPFVRDFVKRYPIWFEQDLGEIMEKELEDVLEEFRGLPFEVEPSTKVVALAGIRDLLIDVHANIAEKEGSKEPFSVDNLLKIVEKSDIPLVDESVIKGLRTSFEAVQKFAGPADIKYPNYSRFQPLLDCYLWRMEVKMLLNKKGIKPDQLYKLLRTCPDVRVDEECIKIGKKLKLAPLDDPVKDVKKATNDYLNDKINSVDLKRVSDKGLITEIKNDETFRLVRLVNKLGMNEGKLNDYLCEQLTDMGFGQTRHVLKFQGKETAMKKLSDNASNDNLSRYEANVDHGSSAMVQESLKETAAAPVKPITSEEKKRDEGTQTEAINITFVREASRDEATPEKMNEEENFSNKKIQTEKLVEQVSLTVVCQAADSCEMQEESFAIVAEVKVVPEEPQEEIKEQEVTDAQPEVHQEENQMDQEELPTNQTEDNQSAQDVHPQEAEPEKMMEEEIPQQTETIEQTEEQTQPKETPVEENQVQAAPAVENATEPIEEPSKVELERPQENISEKTAFTVEEAKQLISQKQVPTFFEGTFEEFSNNFLALQEAVQRAATSEVDLNELSATIEKINKSSIEFPQLNAFIEKESKAKAFSQEVLKLTPKEVVENKNDLINQSKTLQVVVPEFKRILEDIDRDSEIAKEVENAIIRRNELSLKDILCIKNKNQSARYFKSRLSTLKIFDIFIMAIIKEYKKDRSNPNDEPQLDYVALKDCYGVVAFEDTGKKRYINPGNAEFIVELYNKVEEYIKRNINKLTLEDMEEGAFIAHYRNFIDLTGKCIEHRFKLQEKAMINNRSAEKGRPKVRTLKPSGMMSEINKPPNYEHHLEDTIVKPAFTSRVGKEHRKYYVSKFRFSILHNKYLNYKPEKAHKVALDIERIIFKKHYKESAITYENDADSVLKMFEKLGNYKYITLKAREKGFNPDWLTRFNFSSNEMAKFDADLRNATELAQKREEALKESQAKEAAQADGKATKGGKVEREQSSKCQGQKPDKKQASKPSTSEVPVNPDIEPKITNLIKDNLKAYRIFEGPMLGTKAGKPPHLLEHVVLNTFNSKDKIEIVSAIHPKTALSTGLSFNNFTCYMEDSIISKNKTRDGSYRLLQGWVETNESSKDMSRIISRYGCTLSTQLSPSCKIFIYPAASTPSNWLEKLDFWLDDPKTDLAWILVVKPNQAGNEEKIKPVLLHTTSSHYKLVSKSHIMEREVYQPKKQSKPQQINQYEEQPHKRERVHERYEQQHHYETPEEFYEKVHYNDLFKRASKMLLHNDPQPAEYSQNNQDYRPPSILNDYKAESKLGKRSALEMETESSRNLLSNVLPEKHLYSDGNKVTVDRKNAQFERLIKDMTLKTSRKNNLEGPDPDQSMSNHSSSQKLISYLSIPSGPRAKEFRAKKKQGKENGRFGPKMANLSQLLRPHDTIETLPYPGGKTRSLLRTAINTILPSGPSRFEESNYTEHGTGLDYGDYPKYSNEGGIY